MFFDHCHQQCFTRFSLQMRANLLTTQPFKDTFGPNRKRKRPKIGTDNLAEMAQQADMHHGR